MSSSPKISANMSTGALCGLVAVFGAFLGEGLIFSGFSPFLGPLWNVGLGWPFVVVFASIAGALGLATTTPDQLKLWLVPTEHRVRSISRRFYVLSAGAVVIGVGVLASALFVETFTRPLSIALASMATAAVGAGVAFAFSRSGISLFCWIFDRLPARLSHPMFFWGVIGVGWLGAHLTIYLAWNESFTVIPWHFEAFVVMGALSGLATMFIPSKPRIIVAGLLTTLSLMLALWTFFALPASGKPLMDGTVSATFIEMIREPLDTDGDGVLAYYGENDCAPKNAAIHPNAVDLPDNGRDENCNGVDLSLDSTKIKRGPVHVPLPASVKNRTPHVILLTSDALSFSRTSLAREDRDTTPNLAEWAKDAIVFERAFASSNATRLSIPGLVLGKHNLNVKFKVAKRHPYPYKGEKTIVERMHGSGYHTVFVPGDKYFWRWTSMRRGFDEVLDSDIRKAKDIKHTAPEVTSTIIDAIESRDPEKPFFMWAHYYDHHAPFNPRSDGEFIDFGSSQADRFDSELAYADKHWKFVFEAIEKSFGEEDYIVIFTSDHGEIFDRTATKKTHSVYLDHEVVHVPLVIKVNGQKGKRVPSVVSHLDVMPTLANLIGWKRDKLWRGQSLINVLYTEATQAEGSIAVSVEYIPERVRKKKDPFDEIAIHTEQHFLRKRFQSPPVTQLFDWEKDPFNKDDLSASEPELFEVLNAIALSEYTELRKDEHALNGSKVDKRKAKKKKSQKKK